MPDGPIASRTAWSCEACKRRKVRCDRHDPCAHCVRRGERCEWPFDISPREDSISWLQKEEFDSLKKRVHTIELILERANLLLPAGPLIEEQMSFGNEKDVATQQRMLITEEAREGSSPAIENTMRAAPSIGELATANKSSKLQGDVNLHDNFDHHILNLSTNPHDRRVSSAIEQASKLLQVVLPTQNHCEALFECYFERVEWIHHVLHVPTFCTQYKNFWKQYSTDPHALPPLEWLSLMLIVFCLGSHFTPNGSSLGAEEKLFAASREMMNLSDHLAKHNVTVIQTLIMMGLWLNNRGQSKLHQVHLSIAIKMAFTLRLNRVDSTYSDTVFSRKDDDSFFSLSGVNANLPVDKRTAQDETLRRIWWSLVGQDYYTASSVHFSYSIQPAQSKTAFFLNLDDEELASDTNSEAISSGHSLQHTATCSTYHLLKIPFARFPKVMADLYNSDTLSYDAILSLECQLRADYHDLPDYFKWSSPPEAMQPFPAGQYVSLSHLQWQRVFLAITLHNRILRLHRPFMARGYVDSTKFHSKQVTLISAGALLEIAEYGERIAFPGLRWWVILVHLFTAGVAFCIDLHFLAQHESVRDRSHSIAPTYESRLDQVSRVLKLLKPSSGLSVAAEQAMGVIENLMLQVVQQSPQSRSQGGVRRPTKRQRVETSNSHPLKTSILAKLPSNDVPVNEPPTAYGKDWIETNEISLDSWAPDWDQLLELFSHNDSTPQNGATIELMEAMAAFTDGFSSR